MASATYVYANPVSIIAKAMFNFDSFGIANFKYSGLISISTSLSFDFSTYINNQNLISYDVYTNSQQIYWNISQLSYINSIASNYHSFANINFTNVVDYSQYGYTPANVGSLSDINISFIYRNDRQFSGMSAIDLESNFKYQNSAGDIVLNYYGFGSSGLANDITLNPYSYGWHTLMHEIGHSLGLSHPHSTYSQNGVVLTADYSATANIGFSALGFHINSASSMNKEYFSIMSYDDQQPRSGTDTYAQTPMILDVIALQEVYGIGSGTSGSENNTITAGGNGAVDSYRTYFDLGGLDTINLINYSSGAYLNMGATIIGATHLVGVSMSQSEGMSLITNGTDPVSLRWYYGEYENAIGSDSADKIFGNSLNNHILGGLGDDNIAGGLGNDVLDGGVGNDTAFFSGSLGSYRINRSGNNIIVSGSDGRDILSNFEQLNFSSTGNVNFNNLLQSSKYQFTPNDFNGDGNTDVLWRNPTNNLVGLWSVSSGQYNWSLIGQVSSTMTLAGTGDFNGDGTTDVLWQDPTTNSISLWAMSNGTPNLTSVGTGSTTMKIAAIGDFNGDGSSDVLWQNPTNNLMGVWSMRNGQPTWSLIGMGSTTMKVAGVGDFNGDGTTDLLWLNPNNNLVGIWSMNNNQASWSLVGQGSTTMNISGFGDFNGDGTTDILWLNPANNLIGVWSMNNNNPTWSMVGQGSTTMNIAAIGDYNADGTSDIMWLNPTNNLLGTWTMSSNTASWTLIGSGSTTMKVV